MAEVLALVTAVMARVMGVVNHPLPLIDVVHASAVALEYRETGQRQQLWLQRLIAVVLTALGGTTMTGLLLGQPPSWLGSSEVLCTYIACWWVTHHLPGVRSVLFWLYCMPPSRFCILLLDDVTWAVAITAWGVDKAPSAAHEAVRDSVIAALLCGTLSGCGGGLLQRTFGLTRVQWQFGTPADLRTSWGVSFPIMLSFACATLYYVLTDPHDHVQALRAQYLPGVDDTAVRTLGERDTARFMIICTVVLCSSVRTHLWKLLFGAAGAPVSNKGEKEE